LHPGDARRCARVLAEPPGRPVLRERAVAELAARGSELLPASVARADLHGPGRLRGPAGHRRVQAAGAAARPADRVPPRPVRRDGAEHRRVRLAARLDLLHRRARGAHPRSRPAVADRGVGAGRAHDHIYDLPGVALRGRRHRGRAAGGHGARAGADRVRRAHPATPVHGTARPRLMSVARAHSAVRSVGWRAIAAGPAVAAVTVIVALVATGDVDVPLRDPDNVAATYFVLVGFGVALLVWLDVAIRAARAEGAGFPPSREAMGRVRRERWTAGRAVVAASALLGFYVT